MTTSPNDEVTCPWCGQVTSSLKGLCTICLLPLSQSIDVPVPKVSKTTKKQLPTTKAVFDPQQGHTLGIDPGYRYTGVSLLSREGTILYSATYTRPTEMLVPEWCRILEKRLKDFVSKLPEDIVLGIENVSAPKGFKRGSQAPLNPRDIMFTAMIVGFLMAIFPEAHLIKPGGNGSHPKEEYPPELIGRRPLDLPGENEEVSTRNHERSAYDVAVQASQYSVS